MALLNSLFSGVSGLRNHQSMMDVIGNNIANVNTVGFKGSRMTFSDTFNNFIKAGTKPSDVNGGSNTFQIGLGMQINSIDRNWNQGTFERTGIITDLALQGEGLFVLKSKGETFYSRAGNFSFDAEGRLISPGNGAVVQGKVADKTGQIPAGNNLEDIVIDTNMRLPATATSFMKWGGNLKSNSTLTRSEKLVQQGNINSALPGPFTNESTVYNDFGDAYKFVMTYTKTGANQYDLGWEVFDSAGVSQGTGSINGLNFVDDGTGNFSLDAASKALFDGTNNAVNIGGANLSYTFDAKNITQNASTSTLSTLVDDNRKPNIINGSMTVFDSLGNAHQVTLKFTKLGDNQWSWSASVPGTSTTDNLPVSSTGTLTFNSDGTLNGGIISPSNPQLSFSPVGGAEVVVAKLDFGSGLNGLTQTSANSVISALSQDGSASAFLSNLNIDQLGNIIGIFSNGESQTLAQIMVATFPNLHGLISNGDNMYSAYANSGEARIGSLGEETGTIVQAGALEQSNVDLSEEFTRMIVTQRGFQANARVITTADQLLQEITSLIR